MPGFGSGPFGKGAFGEWPWASESIVDGIPAVYKEQDEGAGNGTLSALLEGLVPSLESLRRKIRDYDILRNPLLAPVDTSFQTTQSILRSENLGDGTSRVFLSAGSDGDNLDGLRVGMVLIDSRGYRFTICSVATSTLAADVDDPPVDPATGALTGRYVIVNNIGQVSTEFIPFVSGTIVEDEDPLAGAFPNSPNDIDDGAEPPPYIFNVEGSYLSGDDIALNRVTVTWEEGGDPKTGFFVNTGNPGGDLADTSEINYDVASTATGQIVLYTASGATIDADTIRVSYTRSGGALVEDAEVRAQNILAFLAADRAISLDLNDPEVYQRSFTNSAFKIWEIKGTANGYRYMGELGGYFVEAIPLYAIPSSLAVTLDPATVIANPEGEYASGSIAAVPVASLVDGETFTLSDGENPPVTFEFDTAPISVTAGNVSVDISAATTASDVGSAMATAINGATFLNLAAVGGSTVTVTNTVEGVVGNVTDWSDTVSDPNFMISQPTGGIDPVWFTIIAPTRLLFDEVIADIIPLDTLCSEDTYPGAVQTITVTEVVAGQDRGSETGYTLTVSTAEMYLSFGTFGELTDANANLFDVLSYTRLTASTFEVEVASSQTPVVGAGSIDWRVLRFTAPNTVTITGIGTDVEDLGRQTVGYSGRRYRVTKTFTDPPLASIGNWLFIDADGVASYIERFENIPLTSDYEIEFVSETVPAAGTANVYASCSLQPSCDFCAASSVIIRVVATAINGYPEAIDSGSFDRISGRVLRMVPGHVKPIILGIVDPPELLSITPGDGTNTLTWTDVDGAVSYNVYWDTSPDVSPSTSNKITGVVSPYLHGGLTNGVTYYYVVVAVGI